MYQCDIEFCLSLTRLLSEYHELYELQRARLEAQVIALSREKELWSGAAYNLALKVKNTALFQGEDVVFVRTFIRLLLRLTSVKHEGKLT